MGEKAKRQPIEYTVGRAGGFHWKVSVRSDIFLKIFINDMEMQNDMPVKQGKKRGEKKLVKPIAKKKKSISIRLLVRQSLK